MSSIPLVALAVRPQQFQDPVAEQGRLMQLRALGQQTQQQAALAPGQLQQQQQGLQLGQQAIQQGQFAVQDREAGMKAMQQWDGKDINELPDLIQKNGGSFNAVLGAKKSAIESQQQIANLTTAQLAQNKTKSDYLLGKLQAASGKDVPDEQLGQSIMNATQEAINDGYLDPPHAQEVQQMIQQYSNPADLRTHLGIYEKGLMSQTEQFDQEQKDRATAAEEQKANAADWKDFPTMGVALNTRTGEVKTPAGQTMSPQMMEGKYVQIQQAQKLGQPVSDADKAFVSSYEKMKELVPAFNFSVQSNALQGNAKDMAAENYFQTGQMPQGMRSPGMVSSIISRAAELHPSGVGDLAGNRAAYEANKKSYDNVTSTLDTLSAFESSANKNMDQFLNLTKKLPDSGVPWANTPIRNLNQNLVGNEWMPAINAARSVMDREIARVTNDPKLTGALTDTARAEVSSLNPDNATLPQIVHLTQTLRNDMTNVHTSLSQQKQDIGTRLGIKSGSTQAGGGAQGGGQTQSGAPSTSDSSDPFAQFGGKKH